MIRMMIVMMVMMMAIMMITVVQLIPARFSDTGGDNEYDEDK